MTFMDRMAALLSRKSSRAGAAVAAVGLAPARWTPRRYDRLAEEGYRRNVVAYRCIREVSRACASVPWLLYKGAQELDTHPLLDLLRVPNPRQSGSSLIETAVSQLLLSGNAYLEVVRPSDGSPPRELYALRPDRMRVVPDVSGVPRAYRYEVEGRTVDWSVDPVTGESDVLHLREFHPLDDWYGLSPIEAAASAIDQHNAAAEHNAALLQNGARPSGALVFRTDPGPDGIRRVEEALLDRTHGPANAGRPLVLGGDVDWKELGFSPRDMDFAAMKAQAAREISAAFGVPHLLVVAGEATYANRADARLELWEHTIIPMLDRLASALSAWLGPMFGEGLRLATDLDEIPALAPRRRMKWQQIQQADFLSLNEKRQALGYAPVAQEQAMPAEEKALTPFEAATGQSQPRDPLGQWSETGRAADAPGTRVAARNDTATDATEPQLDAHGKPLGVDWDFVSKEEGGQWLEGYVPKDAKGRAVGKSGVTIATGYDLGSKNAAEIRKLGIQPPEAERALIEKLTPYFGLQGQPALDFLTAQERKRGKPALEITPAEAQAIDSAKRIAAYREVRGRYNAAAKGGLRFEALEKEARTVLVSVAFQYGNLKTATRKFWEHMTHGDWPAAIRELENFHDAHGPRREREAALLRQMIRRTGR